MKAEGNDSLTITIERSLAAEFQALADLRRKFGAPLRPQALRIPFGSLIERGLVRPGEVLFDHSRRWTARVRADGSVLSGEHCGSIHSVAAQIQGAPACNGWAFWYVQRGERAKLIDEFRQELRAEQRRVPLL
jgi:modification methylase